MFAMAGKRTSVLWSTEAVGSDAEQLMCSLRREADAWAGAIQQALQFGGCAGLQGFIKPLAQGGTFSGSKIREKLVRKLFQADQTDHAILMESVSEGAQRLNVLHLADVRSTG